jgi:imidazolonepropionase-like amidohydrolase
MANVLFTNVRVMDGSGEYPFTGEVLVQGNRVRRVARGSRNLPTSGLTVIDGAGATLMPGMTEAHTHFSWNDQPSLDAIFRMPPEEHTLFAAAAAKLYLDSGFTSCVGAAAAKPRLDVVIRNAISGQIPGHAIANSQEIGTVGGLGDTAPPQWSTRGLSFACIVSGRRRCAGRFAGSSSTVSPDQAESVGEEIAGLGAEETPMDEDEIAAVREAKSGQARVRSCAQRRSVKLCVKHGIEIIYHASFADEEALDLLEKHRTNHFVAPVWRG